MATLKIVCDDQTHRLCNVRAVSERHHFELPEEFGEKDIPSHCWKGFPAAQIPRQYTVTHFSKGERHGVVLIVDRNGDVRESEWWVVPARQCFLLADDGRTIDRM